jgi:hypothetical protein
VRAAIDRILDGTVAEFAVDGGDRARMLSLDELRAMEAELDKQLARLVRGARPRFLRAQRY